jgi:hypothetical protein
MQRLGAALWDGHKDSFTVISRKEENLKQDYGLPTQAGTTQGKNGYYQSNLCSIRAAGGSRGGKSQRAGQRILSGGDGGSSGRGLFDDQKPSCQGDQLLLGMKPITYNRPSRHKFKGDTFKILWKPAYIKGEPQDATTSNCKVIKVITIDPHLSERRLLKVLIDEGLHACNWDLDNDAVGEYSDAISSLLFKVGFRLPRISDDGD